MASPPVIWPEPPVSDINEGTLTRRDYFAAAAMQTLLDRASAMTWKIDTIAKYSYDMADAMIERSAMEVPEPTPEPMKKRIRR